MANYTVRFYQGLNHISIPLDMSGGSYEDDPKILFNPSLQQFFSPNGGFQGEYVFQTIYDGTNYLHNTDGEWVGADWNVESKSPLIVFCNPPGNSNHIDITFQGDTISTPSSINYDLDVGWNIISFPYSHNMNFGEGSYTSQAIDFLINPDFLKGSGHADECINRILQVQNNKYVERKYDGSGSSSTDWTGDLSIFKPGFAIYLYSDTAKTSKTLYQNDNENNSYNFLLSTTGVSNHESSGNAGMSSPATQVHNSNPLIGTSSAPTHETSTFRWTYDSPLIKDSGGTDILKVVDVSGTDTLITGSVKYQMGFFVERLFNVDADKPNWGNRGLLYNNYTKVYTLRSDQSYLGLEHDDDTDIPMYTSSNNESYATWDIHNNSTNHRRFFRIELVTDVTTGNPFAPYNQDDMDSNTIWSGFRPGDYAVPVVYDPNATDGERYRYCKYYPNLNDKNGGTPNSQLYRDMDEYYDIFYDDDGELKISSEYGHPYIEPVYKRIPYKVGFTGSTGYWMGRISGIFQML